jgi:protein-disulfide isomerase
VKRFLPIVVFLLSVVCLAQDWKTLTTLPKVDFTGLSPARKTAALRLLRNHNCSCGCNMKVAECRVKDPGCAYSRGLAEVMVDALKSGKTASDAMAAANESRWSHLPTHKTLDDAVPINIAGSPVTGPADARITLVEFSDFQCPYCLKAVDLVHAVMRAYPTQVKLVFKQFPLDMHSQAALAANAALAAHHQGKFWEMHDAMFANHRNLARPTLLALAGGLKLDVKRFTADLDSPQTKHEVDRDIDDGDHAGVEGTPTFFINGQRYNGPLELEAIRPILNDELKKPAKH